MATWRRLTRLAARTGQFWTDAYVLYLAARDSRVPFYARIAAGAFAIYVLSPIDIVPDPIPFIGIVDDFIIIPIGLMLIGVLVPNHLRQEHQELALIRQPGRPSIGQAFEMVGDTIQRMPLPKPNEIPNLLARAGREARTRAPELATSARRKVPRLRRP